MDIVSEHVDVCLCVSHESVKKYWILAVDVTISNLNAKCDGYAVRVERSCKVVSDSKVRMLFTRESGSFELETSTPASNRESPTGDAQDLQQHSRIVAFHPKIQ